MIAPSTGVVSRRAFGAGVLALAACPAAAVELSGEVAQAVRDVLRGRDAIAGDLKLLAPNLAENGAQVPVTFGVDGPMTRERHVTALHLVATRNPTPGIVSVQLGPSSGIAKVSMRIRLAEGQQIVAFAEWSDGTVWRTAAEVKVSAGGCLT